MTASLPHKRMGDIQDEEELQFENWIKLFTGKCKTLSDVMWVTLSPFLNLNTMEI